MLLDRGSFVAVVRGEEIGGLGVVHFSLEQVELLVGHGDGELHRRLGLVEIGGGAAAARRLPGVVILLEKRDLPELLLAQPQDVGLVGPFPDGLLFFRRPLQPSSSAPSSSSCVLPLRRNPSAIRTCRAPSSGSWCSGPS